MNAGPARTLRARAVARKRALWRVQMPSALALVLVAALVLVWLASSAGAAQAQVQTQLRASALQPGPALQADGIPPLARPARSAAANDEPPALRFVAWHPQAPAMLVLAPLGGTQQLHLLAGPGARPRPLTRGQDGVEGARWEPETGSYLVFRRDVGGNEAWRLYRLATEGGDAEAITPAGLRVSAYQFLPRGQGLVVVADRLDSANPDDERRAHSRLLWLDPLQPQTLRLLDEAQGGKFENLQVTTDGAVLATRRVGRRTDRLRFASPQPEARQALGSDALADKPAELEAGTEWLWSAQAVQGDFRHLVRTDARSGRRSTLLADVQADIDALAPPPPGSSWPLAVSHNERGVSTLRLLDLAAVGRGADAAVGSAALRPLPQPLPPGVVRGLRWHPRLPWLAIDHQAAASASRLWVWDHARQQLQDWGPQRRSAAADTEKVSDKASNKANDKGAEQDSGSASTVRVLQWASFDGLAISGLHVAPPARFTGPRPVFISLHSGPASQARPRPLSPLERRLVEQLGMHVIWPNVRGSDGFGKQFLTLDDGRRREDAVKDVSALLDLVAKTPDMDAGRVVVQGGSYGGYLSLAVAVHESGRIAGSICQVGIANFVTFLEQTESYRRDNRRAEYGDERDPAMREFLLRISPVTRASDIRKPLFVVHGRNDPRVPYGEAEQVVRAVRGQGTPVWFLTADDEGHGFKQAANRSYLLEATTEFVRRLLAGEPLQ